MLTRYTAEMTTQNPLVFEDLPGYTQHISRLLSMMQCVRDTTLYVVKDLSTAQLDYLPHSEGNSIGMLLAHIAAVEEGYYLDTVENQNVDWETPAQALGEAGRKSLNGKPLEHYLSELARVREQTLAGLKNRDDAWLQEVDVSRDVPRSNYYKWFHTFEDEVNHRGQILLIRKLLPSGL